MIWAQSGHCVVIPADYCCCAPAVVDHGDFAEVVGIDQESVGLDYVAVSVFDIYDAVAPLYEIHGLSKLTLGHYDIARRGEKYA